MCHIIPNASGQAASFIPGFPGYSLDIPKDGWIRNTSKDNIRVRCRHKEGGETDTHTLKPGDQLICESEAELTFI